MYKGVSCGGGGSAVYGLGFVGALIYYIQNASSFSEGLIGFLKAIVWPAIFTYNVIDFLKL